MRESWRDICFWLPDLVNVAFYYCMLRKSGIIINKNSRNYFKFVIKFCKSKRKYFKMKCKIISITSWTKWTVASIYIIMSYLYNWVNFHAKETSIRTVIFRNICKIQIKTTTVHLLSLLIRLGKTAYFMNVFHL